MAGISEACADAGRAIDEFMAKSSKQKLASIAENLATMASAGLIVYGATEAFRAGLTAAAMPDTLAFDSANAGGLGAAAGGSAPAPTQPPRMYDIAGAAIIGGGPLAQFSFTMAALLYMAGVERVTAKMIDTIAKYCFGLKEQRNMAAVAEAIRESDSGCVTLCQKLGAMLDAIVTEVMPLRHHVDATGQPIGTMSKILALVIKAAGMGGLLYFATGLLDAKFFTKYQVTDDPFPVLAKTDQVSGPEVGGLQGVAATLAAAGWLRITAPLTEKMAAFLASITSGVPAPDATVREPLLSSPQPVYGSADGSSTDDVAIRVPGRDVEGVIHAGLPLVAGMLPGTSAHTGHSAGVFRHLGDHSGPTSTNEFEI